jgi:uncharacterized membrane protein HdeD (DUF308 family)
VAYLVAVSLVLAVLTFLLGLNEGLAHIVLPFGIAALAFAVVARVMAQVDDAHHAAATVAVVLGVIALAAGLQSALLVTGTL